MVFLGLLFVAVLVLAGVVAALVFAMQRRQVPGFDMPASWKAFAAKQGGFAGDGEVGFRFSGGRVSIFRGGFRTRESARFHDLEPGEYTVLVRTLERGQPQYSGTAAVSMEGLPQGTQSMVNGLVARVFLRGVVLDRATLELALSALGDLERES